MRTQIKTALTLTVGVAIGAVGFRTLHAQTNVPMAYWVTETLQMTDQAAFMNAIKGVPPTLQPYGARYIVLGGKILPGEGPPPKRITIVAFDSFDKARQWVNDPKAAAVRAEAGKYAKSRNYTVEGAQGAHLDVQGQLWGQRLKGSERAYRVRNDPMTGRNVATRRFSALGQKLPRAAQPVATTHGEASEVKLGGFNAPTQDVSGACGSARNETITAWAQGDAGATT